MTIVLISLVFNFYSLKSFAYYIGKNTNIMLKTIDLNLTRILHLKIRFFEYT